MAQKLKRNPFEKLIVTFLLFSYVLVTSGCYFPPPKKFVVFENKHNDIYLNGYNGSKTIDAIDVSFEYDWFIENSPDHKKFFTESITDQIKNTNLFREISIVAPNEHKNKYKIEFAIGKVEYLIFRDIAMLPIIAISVNIYTYWQEQRFVIETTVYKNGKLINKHEHQKSYYIALLACKTRT